MHKKRSIPSYANDEPNQISNEGHAGKYFHQMLNLYDDELDPYEYRLLGHYIRVCGSEGGTCWQGTRAIALITRMSVGQVAKVRDRLAGKGYIRVEPGNRKDTTRVTVVDKMAENVTRFSSKGVHEVNTPVHQMNTGVHEVNTPVHQMNTGVHEVNKRITLEEEPRRRTSEEDTRVRAQARAREGASAPNPPPPSEFDFEKLKAIAANGGRR